MQTCAECPIEAKCYGGNLEPFARAGYYKQDRTTYFECRPSVACVGGNDTARQCKKGYTGVACSSCANVSAGLFCFCCICKDVFHGPQLHCAACAPRLLARPLYGKCVPCRLPRPVHCLQRFYRLDIYCKACPNLAWLLILGFVIVVCILLLIGVWLNQRRINLAALGIGVDFAQVSRRPAAFCWLLCLPSTVSTFRMLLATLQAL